MKNNLIQLRRDAGFLGVAGIVFLAVFTLLRVLLLWHNRDLAETVPTQDVFDAFLIGVRFDLAVTAYILVLPALLLLTPKGLGGRTSVRLWLGVASAMVIFLGIVELDFYREFHTRLNSLAFQYLREDPGTVSRMIWEGYPVIRYLLWTLGLWLLAQFAIYAGNRVSAHPTKSGTTSKPVSFAVSRLVARVITSAAILILLVAAGRSSISSGPPLRWGDAMHSEHSFANHLGLNGAFTLFKAAMATEQMQLDRWWLKATPTETALATTRDMLLTATDTLEQRERYPVQRRHVPSHHYPPGKIKNIVLIIMESFAGAYVGALGGDPQITPNFDNLSKSGLLFTHFFSNGTHTHQGMFATVACFPNLPGHEYLMQQPEGLHSFSGLPKLFSPDSDNNVYVYNGDFRWDNQEGFFRNQGLDHFVGRHQILHPKHLDSVWGVSDEDLFRQAATELDKLSKRGPFYAIVQTLSNHLPFSLPEPLPVDKVTGAGDISEHLTAMRYADWALGQFFRSIKESAYYDETLFILVGDHGFGTNQMVSAIDLDRFRVPMLMIAPGIQDFFGKQNPTTSSQVDIVPTAMGLLGQPFSHQCWGRDLLSLEDGVPGLAIIKPSGSDQTAAIISGNDILTLNPDGVRQLGRLSYNRRMSFREKTNLTQADTLETALKSYIHTALTALADDRAGIAKHL